MMSKERLEEIRTELKALEEEQRNIYKASLTAPEEYKVCEDFYADMLSELPFGGKLEYPIEVNGIHFAGSGHGLQFSKPPKLVAIRPVGDKKTYVGVYLGDVPLSVSCSLHQGTGVLSVSGSMFNPAIAVPALGKIVMGAESWWGEIKSVEQLKEITNKNIDNVWYVKVLQSLNPGLKTNK